jgi:CheY-like chemotaxis protein
MRSTHTILVVDDQPAALYAASKLLKKAGFQTLEASTGEDALRLAKSASAVLIDVNLPDINGVEVCQLIKAAKESAGKPVVLMSAVYVDDLHRGAAMSAGADAFVTPPLDEEPLAATFDRLLAAG